jgi:hypothetical protein
MHADLRHYAAGNNQGRCRQLAAQMPEVAPENLASWFHQENSDG